MRKTLLVCFLSLALAGLATAAGNLKVAQPPVADDGTRSYSNEPVTPLPLPMTSDSPGEVIGVTSYEYQSNGSIGDKIMVDDFGGLHAVWTKGINGSRPRYVYYNFRSEVDSSWTHNPDGTAISGVNGTGFITLDLMSDGSALAGYHSADDEPSFTKVGVDAFRGFGIFTEYNLNPVDSCIWPYIARNVISGRQHMVMAPNFTNGPPMPLQYAYSTDDGATWSAYVEVDSMDALSYIMIASPVSDKTAILYTKLNAAETWYDVFYHESQDGIAWDFRFPVNITQYTANDSLSAGFDIDALYDYNDNLHIVYQGAGAWDNSLWLLSNEVRHWSQAAGHSIVAVGSDSGCYQINYCLCVAKVNIGVDPSNDNLFALWSEMDDQDFSLGGYSNGELYAAGSDDGGATWYPKVNLTNSPTPGCPAMDCDSDVWASLAPKVDGTLHIIYVDDNDAGAAWRPEGVWTTNAVLYLEVDAGDLLQTSIKDLDTELPFEFELGDNYPNPFNAETIIPLGGEVREGQLAIYDITGRTIREYDISSETRSITWDGTNVSGETVASGTYFYSVDFDGIGRAATRKMTLLK
ncbi:MAG: T9SS type A sorting domain-containing protein [Candidatus Zixiibacteriota bacterium]|nr:MAG: T9SS type A sorting domain-containing protein [candidate division Zixibacteria bacterium]